MKTNGTRWCMIPGDGPVVGVAIHNGHQIGDALKPYLAIDDASRLREEDPHTGELAQAFKQNIVVHTSRFEHDLNRAPTECIYRTPEDAWGLHVWKDGVPDELFAAARRSYDRFYEEAGAFFAEVQSRHPRFLVLDIHSYNHKRLGPNAPAADPETNPEVNVGTGSVDRVRWGRLVDGFMGALSSMDSQGFDVRENVKFRGRQFAEWLHRSFGASACCLSVELKKTFMDEWTGELEATAFQRIQRALFDAAWAASSCLEEGA